jgi:TonB dependent receptor/Carboxypeptidase regulatory-like domain/TonB-dependent Receptor Plug Domain
MNRYLALFLLYPATLTAQSNTGELRVKVTDPSGDPVKSSIELVSEANQFRKTFLTDDSGAVTAKRLPFGLYSVQVEQPGFAPFTDSVEVRSAVPAEYHVALSLAAVNTSVTVQDTATLVDPHRTGTIHRIGSETIEERSTSLPGRSVVDLVNSQPGWLYEGNAVLHPRGSEYQTQFVVDGVPLTDNRSPSFGTEIEADDVQSISIYTANIPAEYGRKLGGVVEVATTKDARPGFHGKAVFTGGSFGTADGYLQTQYAWGKNTLGVSADGAMTDRFLNPPVVQNFTNTATNGDFSAHYELDITDSDRLGVILRHAISRFEIPNELLQQAAGQRQDRGNFETMGILSYQHIFNPNVLGDLRFMARDDTDNLSSNPSSTPIVAFQDRGFREEYLKGTLSVHHGIQEWKAGVEADFTHIHEQFRDVVTDFTQFEPGTPPSFNFSGRGRDLEQSGFLQDFIRLGKWTVSAGLRWDHYQLVVNQNAVSPRLGIARYVPSADLVLHASYDRVFQTPAFENILLASSPTVLALNPNVLRLPVEPSHGNYYELGFTKGFFGQFKLDVNYFRRTVNNFADDDQLLDTGVSFPIAFRKSDIYGAEGKLEFPHVGELTGYVSYSYMVASAYLPVTGGLFLGDDASNALSKTIGRFWVSQDQRNTVRTRFRYQLAQRAWVALGAEYGSGLPTEFGGTEQDAVAQFGQSIVNRVNFDRGRVKPSLSADASAGIDLWKRDNLNMRLQADVENLNNRLNVIDFAGLFSGNAVAPPRSFALRLETSF